MKKFIIVQVDYKYCDYLRVFDNKVAYNSGRKELRPFIGALFMIGDIEYFVPLSSPKDKHKYIPDSLDFIKIDNGTLGAINFNNMIPVNKSCYHIVDIKKVSDYKYSILLQRQMRWLNRNYKDISKKAYELYIDYKEGIISNKIKKRCCNFLLLEEKCLEYQNTKELVSNK